MSLTKHSIKKTIKPLTEIPQKDNIDENYFFRMMSPQATKLTTQYDREEQNNLAKLFKTLPNLKSINFIVVGAGPLWSIELAFSRVKNYIAIEPLSNLFIQKQFSFLIKQFPHIQIINKKFQDVSKEKLPQGKSIYAFIFNIISYMENPIVYINKLIRKGDILYISTWNNTKEAKEIRRKYFDYLNSFEKNVIIDPEKTIGLCNLDIFPFNELKYYKNHKRIKGEITDILIIYT